MYTTAETHLLINGDLTAVISRRGGEIRSLKYRDTELIWQGDPAYWEGSAPLLFPFCGRVKDGVYRWQEKDYPMPIHGFLPEAELSAAGIGSNALTLTLTDSPATRAVYPFAFNLSLYYKLHENALSLTVAVTAEDTALPFSFGAHPGFNLPCTADGFTDARLQFDTSAPLSQVEITENGLLGDGRSAFTLRESALPLSPDPAGGCGIFFKVPDNNRALTLQSASLPCDIRMEFADFPILGLWHAGGAPYLCIEPWQGLPAPDNAPTDLSDKPATVILAPGEHKTYTLRIALQQKGTCHV